jgi:signal transduction histidine kinase
MVVARGAGDGITVLTGHALDAVEESIAALTVMLVLGIPLLTAGIGWLVWVMVGRALRPIEAIRSEVDGIGHGELERRVPVAPSDDEVARLAATMNSMLERLEQGQARERRFVSDASHELRSPVATIRQQAELALAHPEGASLNELAENVLAEDLRIQRIVEDLLMLARMDEGAGTITRSAIDLDDTVLNEVKRLENAGVAIDASRVSGGRVAGDPRQLERLVGNLLDNAVRHARGKVSVGLVESDGVVLLTVDDDGPGIPAAERVRVFDRFVRLEGARDRGSGGAGLGLAIVAEVASAHGGRAAVEGSQLGGARVEVRLPRSA